MPLIIEGDGPVSATLPPIFTLAERLLELPGFVGAYDAAAVDLPDGEPVPTWPAELGSAGPVIEAVTGSAPYTGQIGGSPVIQWGGSHAMKGPASWTPARQGTIGGRFHLTVGTNQYLFGGDSTDFSRLNADGTILTKSDSNLTTPAIESGWHNIIRVQDANTVTLYVDGIAYSTARTPVDLPYGLWIGSTPRTDGTVPGPNLTGAVQRWFEATSALNEKQVGYVDRFLNSGLR